MPSRKQKKKRKQKRRNQSPSEDEEIDTVSEMSSVMSFAQEVDLSFTTRYMGDMEGCLEPLTGKRSMTGGAERSKAHVVMISLMSKGVWHEWCLKNAHVLKQIYIESLKHGDSSERINALQSCCFTIVTLGDDLPYSFSSGLIEGILFLVRSHISILRDDFDGADTWGASCSGGVDPNDIDPEEENRINRMVGIAMNILPLMKFFSTEYTNRKEIANILFNIWSDTGYYPSVRAGALEGWVMAICNVKTRVKGSVLFNKAIHPLVEIIEEEPSFQMTELFIAAGSALALLYEAQFAMQYLDESEVESDNEDKTNGQYKDQEIVDTEYIKSLLEGFFMQSSKGVKKDRMKAQRRNFRKFARAVEDSSYSPTVDIKLNKQEFRLEGWTSTICWEYMKRNLAGGLQAHLLCNPWLQNVFGIEGSSLQLSVVQLKQEKVDQVAERRINKKEKYLRFKKARGLKYQVPNDA